MIPPGTALGLAALNYPAVTLGIWLFGAAIMLWGVRITPSWAVASGQERARLDILFAVWPCMLIGMFSNWLERKLREW